jgi:acetyl esterase
MRTPDYATLIEPDYRAYIERVNSWFPASISSAPLGDQRAVYDRMCAAFHLGRPPGLEVSDTAVATADRVIRVRRYTTTAGPSAVVLYFHGGGFVFGGLDSHDDVCAELCGRTGFDVISADYRLAPEHRHPAQLDDALAVFERISGETERPLVLCGESAGGNLAAALAHATRRNPRPVIGQVLIYPDLGGDLAAGSYVEHAQAPMLTTAEVEHYRSVRFAGLPPVPDATTAPLSDEDFSGLPPTVIVTAELDPLASDGPAYRDRIVAAGGKGVCLEQKRVTHSFLRARGTVLRAAKAFDGIARAVTALGSGAWPY